MVGRIAALLSKEIRGLHEAAYLLAFFALLSQILALVRDRLFASEFGAGAVLDLYYASFRIPDLLFVSIASFVSIYVLLPIISEFFEENDKKTRVVLDTVFTVFFSILIIVSIVIAFFAEPLLEWMLPGFTPEQIAQAVVLTRIMLLQPFFLGFSNLLASITQLKGRFILYALSPLLYNIGIILGLVVLYPWLGVSGLAWGVVLGAVLHLAVQLPKIISEGYMPRITLRPDWMCVVRVIWLSLPRTLTLSAQQILLIIFVALASAMTAGSIAVMQFSYNLQSVPLTIIGVSYSVAAFPTLAKLFSKGERRAYLSQITSAMRHIMFWSIPAIVLIVVLRAQIVRVILGSGEFDWSDTRLTAAALALFALSLIGQAFVLLLVRGFYAAGDTKTPLFANLVAIGVTVVGALGLVFVFEQFEFFRGMIESLLRVEGIPGTVVLMLPLAYTLGSILNAILLLFLFERWYGSLGKILGEVFWKGLVASIGGGMASYIMLAFMDDLVDIDTLFGIFMQGFVAGVAGIAVIIFLLQLLGSRELHEAWRAVSHKFWREKTVVPEIEG